MVNQNLDNYYPGSVRQWDKILIDSASTNKQLVRGPWPIGSKLAIRKIVASNTSGLPVTIVMWDQDLSSTSLTPVSRGSALDPLIVVGVGATNTSGSVVTTNIGANLPVVEFEAGVAVQATGFPGTHILVEFERI